MEKNLMINIAVDNVPLSAIEEILAGISDVLEDYPDKRISTTLQDQPLVKFG